MTEGRVLVVGAGPTGLVTAGLLARAGVDVDVVERNPGPSDEAKAISIDDESLRVIQHAGLLAALTPALVPGTGTKYFGARGQELTYARGGAPLRLGHAFKSPFAQPDLERALVDALQGDDRVHLQFGVTATALSQTDSGVNITLTSAPGTRSVDYDYVVGADGGQSTVRRLLSIEAAGRSFPDTWLVVDTVGDNHRERYGMHHGSPERPCVIIPGKAGRCRYEFRLKPGEAQPGERPNPDLVGRLIGAYRDVVVADDIERATVYQFHARVATRWRVGRILLAGDAAHMMPPFAGQGLNSGIRDADNLAWKVAAVLHGRSRPDLLDTYEQERRPHVEAMVKLSYRLGRIVMTTDRRLAWTRDTAIGAALHFPPAARWLREMRFRPAARHVRGFTLPVRSGPGALRAIPGVMIPQPRCYRPDGSLAMLDDVLGPGFALVGVGCGAADWTAVAVAELAALGCRRVDVAVDDMLPEDGEETAGIADADGALAQWCEPLRGRFALVRPDRYVAAVFAGAEVGEVASWLRQWVVVRQGVDTPT